MHEQNSHGIYEEQPFASQHTEQPIMNHYQEQSNANQHTEQPQETHYQELPNTHYQERTAYEYPGYHPAEIHPYDSVSHLSQQQRISNQNHAAQPTSNFRDSLASKSPKKRYCCGCFQSRRGCCTFYVIFFILLGIAIGLLVFFLYPRIPQFTVSEPIFTPNVSPFSSSTSNGQASFEINFSVNVDVASKNYISYDVRYFTK